MKTFKLWGVGATVSLLCLLASSLVSEAGTLTAGKTHIGTFEGTTTFTTSSSNGINPGLFIEVRDIDGNLKQYESEEGVITVENTKEGAYVTQAKLLGKTKYRDQDSGELLDEWEAGRNLRLESVENPVLTTCNFKSIVDFGNIKYTTPPTRQAEATLSENAVMVKDISNTNWTYVLSETLTLEGSEKYTLAFNVIQHDGGKEFGTRIFDAKNNVISVGDNKSMHVFTTPSDGIIKVGFYANLATIIKGNTITYKDISLTKGTTAKPLEGSVKTNILTVNEDTELRGIGDIQDELDLLTGEVTERIGELVITDNTPSKGVRVTDNGMVQVNIPISVFNTGNGTTSKDNIRCDKFTWSEANILNPQEGLRVNGNTLHWAVSISKLSSTDLIGVNNYLSNNPITVQYQLATEKSIKTVGLNATYEFNLVSDSVVKVHGDILPTIYSITVPSEPLTFTIDPNAETGKQFIAPEFEITNQSPGPIQLELKAFEQVTNLFNDVLPDEHEDWSQLNKKQSKDIALALVPQPSDAWLTLNEGPKYVVNSANTLLGEIRKDATVHFSFSAYHGGVFEPNLSPEYRLVFTFGF